MSSIARNICQMGLLGKLKACRGIAAFWVMLALVPLAQAAPLLEEGFNYSAGTGLAANSPWTGGSGTSVGIVAGNLSLAALRGIVPAGNRLQVGGGPSRTVYRSFGSTPVTNGAVYFSALIQCTLLPTNSQFIASLMSAGNTSPNQPDDPLDLYVTTATNGYTFRVSHTGDDPVTVRKSLPLNTTHLIVLKYTFGSGGLASIYVDPTPGGTEPTTPDARTSNDEGSDAANLQVVLFRSPNSAAQGNFNFDTLRFGTNWADVTPIPNLLSLSGPDDQGVCVGSSASFSVATVGTPPYNYHWRTNGVPIANATNSTLLLNNPGTEDALKNFDVVVNDTFGSITSRVAKLTFSTNAASITIPPASQLVMPGSSSATFSAEVAGDAPLSFQWRTNGIAIPGATNLSYILNNPAPTDAALAFDFVVANPCGSVASAPVGVCFPNPFYDAFDAGAGFFSGENLILTNASGMNISVWSSPDLSLSVTNWTSEGTMSELPLGTSGESRYGINLNPVTSPVYYIFAQTNSGPYLPTEPLVWLTTADYVSFVVNSSNTIISAAGIFNQNSFATAYDSGAGFFGGENLILTNASGSSFSVWSSPDLSVAVTNWTFEGSMTELPLGTSGQSRYGINLNPATSPVYYIFAPKNTGPYTETEALIWLTTADYASFVVTNSNIAISAEGVFAHSSVSAARNSFSTVYDAGAGFFSGENLIFDSASGISFFAWSSPDPSVPVTNWKLEGAMTELPLGDTGQSRYGINVNPITSPIYYIFAESNTGPYTVTEPVAWLITSDYFDYQLTSSIVTIDASGILGLPALPGIIQPPQSQTVLVGNNVSFSVLATGSGLGYQWYFNNVVVAGASASLLNLKSVSLANAGAYSVVVTNAAGAVTSSVATLGTSLPPTVSFEPSPPGTVQFSGQSVTGLTYVVECATNLLHPTWKTVWTNNTGNSGSIIFQANTVGAPAQFYRVVFP